MTSNHSSNKQRGSLLIVALGSLLVIGTVAAGLNVLIVQDAGTSSNTIEAMQNTSIEDSLYLFERNKLETDTPPGKPSLTFKFNEKTKVIELLGDDKDGDGERDVLREAPSREYVRAKLSDRFPESELEAFREDVRNDLKETLYE